MKNLQIIIKNFKKEIKNLFIKINLTSFQKFSFFNHFYLSYKFKKNTVKKIVSDFFLIIKISICWFQMSQKICTYGEKKVELNFLSDKSEMVEDRKEKGRKKKCNNKALVRIREVKNPCK